MKKLPTLLRTLAFLATISTLTLWLFRALKVVLKINRTLDDIGTQTLVRGEGLKDVPRVDEKLRQHREYPPLAFPRMQSPSLRGWRERKDEVRPLF